MLSHRNNYLLCDEHARAISRKEGKVYIPMERFRNGAEFCCGKCAREGIETQAEVLVLIRDSMETSLTHLRYYLNLDLEGITYEDFLPLGEY
ncbi:MAG: hypothetical protein GXO65_06805 [Euryarchaeota archaeon]|nr:hypothetical protein [Euryarchaeota archaeon]